MIKIPFWNWNIVEKEVIIIKCKEKG